eukprot:6172791-Pleurochrysis_carterae.AAC.2
MHADSHLFCCELICPARLAAGTCVIKHPKGKHITWRKPKSNIQQMPRSVRTKLLARAQGTIPPSHNHIKEMDIHMACWHSSYEAACRCVHHRAPSQHRRASHLSARDRRRRGGDAHHALGPRHCDDDTLRVRRRLSSEGSSAGFESQSERLDERAR